MSLDSQFSNLADHPQKPDATTNLVRRLVPLEEELAQETWELIKLRSVLADRELFLANLRAELAAFRVRYLREIGSPYAKLDGWGEKLAARLSKNAGEEFSVDDYERWDDMICELAGEDPRTEGTPSAWWRARPRSPPASTHSWRMTVRHKSFTLPASLTDFAAGWGKADDSS